jgi:glycosyltransferase involved in cell wall biosynthesis
MIKVDLVMWTKNGEKTLGVVLDRINRVIPKEVVNERFIVDDRSTDATKDIATAKGWDVYLNRGFGISDGANTALSYVQADYFCSFEQDVLLAEFWWNSVSRLVQGKDVVVASGLRFLPRSNLFFNIECYQLTRQSTHFMGGYGKTLDNTIWDAHVLRGLGGFPKLKQAGIDNYLFHLIDAKGYKWLVDYNVQSLHLHSGLLNELRHYYFYGLSLPEPDERISKFCNAYESNDWQHFLVWFLKSPVSSLKMAKKMRDARLLLAYPSVRLCWLLGYLKGLGVLHDCTSLTAKRTQG